MHDTPENIPAELDALHDSRAISHLDYYFARSMAGLFPGDSPLAILSCALVSRELSQGKVCLDIREPGGQLYTGADTDGMTVPLPDPGTWLKALEGADMVGRPQGMSRPAGSPLTLEDDRFLYLSKYYDFQVRLAAGLARRLMSAPPAMDAAFLSDALEDTFKGQDPHCTNGQKEAVQKALQHRFTLISGGPGTGKTYITRIIKAILADYNARQGLPAPVFINLAPTGKAASRLDNGATIHSVLIPRKEGPGFVHGRDYPLHGDVVVIDEASMIDLALMTRLLEAVPDHARVILLGDVNQLSPVQAGAVFNDICAARALAPYLVFLDYNFRSGGKTGIENLARAIIANDADGLEAVLSPGQYPDLVFEETGPGTDRDRILAQWIDRGYAPLARSRSVAKCLESLDKFRILCAHNRGRSGTLQINHLCEKILQHSPDSGIRDRFFKGIVMIRANDYHKGLFNGDTGVVFSTSPGTPKGETAAFAGEEGDIRQFRRPDLPAHDPAFSVTIHKAQGSEYDTVLILVPDKISPVVTRQLLYTGVTRARDKAVILGPLEVIKEAMTLTAGNQSNLPRLLDRELGVPPGVEQWSAPCQVMK